MRAEQARNAGRAAGAPLDPAQWVLVDESGTPSAVTRRYGWAPPARRASGSGPRTHGTTTTVGAALTPDGLPVPWMLAAAMDTATCGCYLTEHRAPTLRPGQVVVRETVRVHQAARSRPVLAARQCTLLVLPPSSPSSPDCTPSAPAFSTRNALLRRLGARTRATLWAAMRVAGEALTCADAIAWFTHAGYALPAQPN